VCVCVSLALLILHKKKLMRYIISSSVACLAASYFSTLFYKRHDFRETVVESKMCILFFSTIPVRKTFLLRRIRRDIFITIHTSSRKVSVILVSCNGTRILWTDFRKMLIIPNFMKISLVGAELFHVGGRTDIHTERQA